MFEFFLGEAQKEGKLDWEKNTFLAPYSSFGIGGVSDFIVFPKDTETLVNVMKKADEYCIRKTVFGNATNVLFSDNGFRGVTIFTSRMKSVRFDGEYIYAESGANLVTLSHSVASRGLSGLEFAAGIPGTVGGAVFMNAGAYGSDMSSVVVSSDSVDPVTYSKKIITADEHLFGYRTSVYKNNGYIITGCRLRLVYDKEENIRARMKEYNDKRRQTQPYDKKSAGSTFKRMEGYITAKLIDEAGLKGTRVGGAEVSTKHAGFIVNNGNATSSDVKSLINIVREKILNRFGVEIECEIIIAEE